MQVIAIKDVVIPENRLRREFDRTKLEELAESIATKGLQHAPVLRNDGKTLVAGERRVRALNILFLAGRKFRYNGVDVAPGMMPHTVLADLNPLELIEAEYEENVIRTDLTWLERNEALAGLHRLRTAQATARGATQTFKATATEVQGKPAEGLQITKVRNALLLTEFANDPEVASARSEKEAFNIVKRKLTDKFTAALAKNVKAEMKEIPHVALHGDMRTLGASLEPASFDCVVTDPPYGIDADKFTPTNAGEGGVKHNYKDSHEYAVEIMREVVEQATLLCKPDAAMYLFCDYPDFDWLRGVVAQKGWTAWDRPIFWHKPGGGMMGDTTHGPRRSYETIMFCYRGNKRTTGAYLDVIVHQPKASTRHSAEKPVEVYVDLLRRSTVPGMRVIDFCSGTGPIFVAANKLSLRATGVESDEGHYNTGLTRIGDKE